MISSVATVQLSVQSWDFPPTIPSLATPNPAVILNRQAMSLNLPVKDNQQKQYLGVYIMSLPTKGTLYQRNPDGSRGAIINRPFQYSFPTPSVQYASKILNVSSFWGTSASYNPIQMLGPQDCFRFGGEALTFLEFVTHPISSYILPIYLRTVHNFIRLLKIVVCLLSIGYGRILQGNAY